LLTRIAKNKLTKSKIANFKQAIAEYLELSVSNITLFWKGRVAFYSILKALEIEKGSEIILPAFTCVVVVNPIIYLGARPIYVDIDGKTFNISLAELEKKITGKTKVILAQNTFGLSPDLEIIKAIANKYNLHVVEDCAHGFGGEYKGQKNGTVADAAFFSTQWNKPFSTGIGGIAITKNPKLAERLKVIEAEASIPSRKEEFLLKWLLFVRKRLLKPSIYWYALKIYRQLSKWNLILGSSQGYELQEPKEPPDFLKSFTETQALEGLKYFKKRNGRYVIDLINEHRKKIANLYKEILLDLGIEPPFEPSYSKHIYLKFPLLVKNRARVLQLAQQRRIELGDWFLSPIHPIMNRFELWGYKWGENPVAEYASTHIINLPTHPGVDENYVDKVYSFLKEIRDEIIGCRVPESVGR